MSTIPAIPPQYLTDDGNPAASYLLFVYAAGTTTKITTYTDQALTVPNANPIVLDAAGRATIFLDPSEGDAKVVLEPSVALGGTDPPTNALWTRDNLTVIPAGPNVDVTATAGSSGLSVTEVCYPNSSGTWDEADATIVGSGGKARAIGFPVGGTIVSTGTMRIAGRVTGLSSLSTGTTYYVGPTAGTITASRPTSAGAARVVGVADSTTSLILAPQFPDEADVVSLINIGFSSGQGNTGGGEDVLTSYNRVILADLLSQAGQCLVIEGVLSVPAGTVGTKSAAVKLGSASSVTFYTSTATTASMIVPFRILIRYRTSTTGGMISLAYIDAASLGAPTNYMVNASITGADWTADQTLSITATSSASVTNDVILTDYNVCFIQGPGTLV